MSHTERIVVKEISEAAKQLFSKVTTVVMHQAPHLDEILAFYLIQKYGGINPCPRFVKADIIGTEADHDRNGILPIGCGENCRFNEHRKDIERLPGECATTLVAKFMGINEEPELKRLIAEVLACDTKSGCSPTQLAEMVKVANRQLKTSPFNVLKWTLGAFQAIIADEQYHYTGLPGEKTLPVILKQFDTEGDYFGEDKRVRDHMFRLAEDSERNSNNRVTELASIVRAMYRLPREEKHILEWVETPLLQMRDDQLEFQKTVDAFRKQKMIEVEVQGSRGSGYINCLVVHSDSLHAARAARFIGAKVVVVRNSAGNVMVSVDTKLEWLNLSNMTRMIRWLELPTDGKDVEWKSLGVPATHDLVPNWYYFKKAEQLFNGSQTHQMPASKISTQALIEVLKCSFHHELVQYWCKARHINWQPIPKNIKPLEKALAASELAEKAETATVAA